MQQTIGYSGSIVLPLGEWKTSFGGDHVALESQPNNVSGERSIPVLKLIPRRARACHGNGIALQKLWGSPKHCSANVPVGCQISPATVKRRTILDVGVDHIAKPSPSIEMSRRAKAHKQITLDIIRRPLKCSDVPSDIIIDVPLTVDSIEYILVIELRITAIGDDMKFVRLAGIKLAIGIGKSLSQRKVLPDFNHREDINYSHLHAAIKG